MTIKIGGQEVQSVQGTSSRMSLLLWGQPGVGKTTLAATAPGKKLWVNFDPDGTDSVAQFENIDVVDLSGAAPSIADSFKNTTNPLGLASAMDAYDTIVVDSLTNATAMCLALGIMTTKGATVERPSPGAYGVRNALTLQLVKNVLRLTGKHNKHLVMIAHEGAPVTNDDGVVLFITMMLGGQLPGSTALDFSEVWNINDSDKKRRIGIRPVRDRRPMKTRMFDTTGAPEFEWKFDSTKMTGDGIAQWYDAWIANGKKKLKLPS